MTFWTKESGGKWASYTQVIIAHNNNLPDIYPYSHPRVKVAEGCKLTCLLTIITLTSLSSTI